MKQIYKFLMILILTLALTGCYSNFKPCIDKTIDDFKEWVDK